MDYYKLSADEVLKKLSVPQGGLSEEQAAKRLQEFGPNELPKGKKRSFLLRFLDQFKNVMILILLAAAVVSAFTGEVASSIVIFIVIILNSLLGVIQEGRAEKSLSALQSLSSPRAKVRRNGAVQEIESAKLVPGDVVLLEAGSMVPADIRLTVCASLKSEEAALTGESLPSEKSLDVPEGENVPLGDRKNMVYSGGNIVYGRGEGAVTATGLSTEVGKIAAHLAEGKKAETPLQIRLNKLSKVITWGVLVIAAVIFAAGLLYRRDAGSMFMTAISLAVAAIPEGLAAVVTILLAVGVQRMARQNAIIRKLSAVETLGCTEVICSDKTGTLTQNNMTVKQAYFGGRTYLDSEFAAKEDEFALALALCNDVDADAEGKLLGDPTETALAAFAADKGILKPEMAEKYPRVGEIPFDSARKTMSTLHARGGKVLMLTKGAPDIMLGKCKGYVSADGSVLAMDGNKRKEITDAVEALSKQALRVLAYAYKELSGLPQKLSPELEGELIFTGLTGMIDPPREEVFDAVATCKRAGMRPVMITGDHRDTAVAIAKQLGILEDESRAVTGEQLSAMDDAELERRIAEFSVFARVSPEHKVRIVKAWQKAGKVVAMTGDGVNDAPALNIADIGVGMGITGTDVSKGVSSMVLTDDNFATIVLAVKEGRTIYNNIQKAVQYLLSTNLGEVVFMFLGSIVLYPILSRMLGGEGHIELLTAIQLLWINLATDSLPAIALGFEPPEKDVMEHPPRSPKSGFLSDGVGSAVLLQGVTVGLLTLGAYCVGAFLYKSVAVATTLAFLAVGAWSMFQAVNLKSFTQSVFKKGTLRSNPLLLWAILISSILHISVMVIPGVQGIFGLVSLSWQQWLIGIGISALVIPVLEITKVFRRRKERSASDNSKIHGA